MSKIIKTIDYTQNFWEANPDAKLVFDYIKHTEKTSQLLWAYTYFHHPLSPFFEMGTNERLESCRKLLNNTTWAPEDDTKINNDFIRICLSKIEANVATWGKKLDERTEFIDSTPYSATTVDMLEKLMGNTSKILAAYREALAALDKEEDNYVMEGISESALELGLFN